MRKFAFFTLLVWSVCLCVPAGAAVILTPSNVQIPSSPGEIFSFDFVVTEPDGVTARTFQSTISISGPGALTLDEIRSEAVSSELDYWVYGNSDGVSAREVGSNVYEFADNPFSPSTEALLTGDIMARYAFEWGGTVGDYMITLDTNTAVSFFQLGDFITMVPLAIDPDGWLPGDSSSFTVHIPEPTTLMLFGLAGTILLRKRRA